MRAAAARADRQHAVRIAAEGWRNAGAIDEATLRAIASAYPDDRLRLGLGLRLLAGFAGLLGGGALAALIGTFFAHTDSFQVLAFLLAIAFAAATELQVGRLRRAQAGAEYATGLLAAFCAGLAWALLADNPAVELIAAGFALTFAAASWRWGYAIFAAIATALILVACSSGVLGRPLWLALGLAAFPLILRWARSPRWPPAHRRCFVAAGVVFLVGAYVAINLYSLDHRWVESLGRRDGATKGAWMRGAAIAGTILVPPLVLWFGARFRDRAFLAAGALFTAASLVTLRRYHPIGPWWLSLVLGGAACLALATALRRWLDAGPGHERHGFTSEPLFAHRRLVEAAQAAATLVALSPGPRVAPGAGFEGGGGRSGGGGATGEA
jgi:hypothetical protein